MKLVTVEAAFPAADLDRAVALFEEQAGAVRAMDGCEGYALYRAAGESGTVGIIQRWRSTQALDAYRASPTFATLGQGLKPLMSAPPVTTVAEIDG